jgi:DNA-binding MarR family transcriptional regulator
MARKIHLDPDYQLWNLIQQVRHVTFQVRERELAKSGLTAIQSAVIFVISANGGKATSSTISAWLLREQHTVSDTLSRMEKAGLIKKSRNPAKFGELTVYLTQKGKAAASKIENIDLIKDMLSVVPVGERPQLFAHLKNIRDRALSYLVVERSAPYP